MKTGKLMALPVQTAPSFRPCGVARSIADVVAAAAKDAGTGIELIGFVRFQLGEGIEKKQEDFAAEVAAAAGTSKAEPVA